MPERHSGTTDCADPSRPPVADKQHFSRLTFGPGEFIFRAGEPGDAAYIIDRGAVEILGGRHESAARLALLGPGEMFGEMAAIDQLPRSASARAITTSTLLYIDALCLKDLLQGSDPVVQYILQALIARLRKRGDYSGVAVHPAATAHMRPGGNLHNQMLRTLTVVSDLSHAIQTHDLELHYQPLMHLESGRIAGFEALMRWKPASLGQVSPDEFIAIAERSGLIHQLGAWMLHRATREWSDIRSCCPPVPDHPPTFLSLNFSAPELSRIGLADILEWCINERNIPANELNLELTERLLPQQEYRNDPGFDIAGTMQQVRNLGINLALDDMGTGYAGLGTLQQLPFSSIKIDKSFIQKITTCERSLQIVQAMLLLARALGLRSTAEGVEDEATHRKLVELGCTYGQGYYYARPMKKPDIMAWVCGQPVGQVATYPPSESPVTSGVEGE